MSCEQRSREEEQAAAPISASTSKDNVEIEPLSGKPVFHTLILKSHICSPYSLGVPAKFIGRLPRKASPVILLHGGRSWEMGYTGNHPTHKRFDPRWKAFALDNKLNLGDICIFELISYEDALIKFKVQILRGDFPSVLLDREEGSPNNPVLINDD